MSFKTKIVCSCNEKNIANLICIDAFCENREKNPIYCSEYCSKKHNHQSFMISPVIEYLFLKYSGQEQQKLKEINQSDDEEEQQNYYASNLNEVILYNDQEYQDENIEQEEEVKLQQSGNDVENIEENLQLNYEKQKEFLILLETIIKKNQEKMNKFIEIFQENQNQLEFIKNQLFIRNQAFDKINFLYNQQTDFYDYDDDNNDKNNQNEISAENFQDLYLSTILNELQYKQPKNNIQPAQIVQPDYQQNINLQQFQDYIDQFQQVLENIETCPLNEQYQFQTNLNNNLAQVKNYLENSISKEYLNNFDKKLHVQSEYNSEPQINNFYLNFAKEKIFKINTITIDNGSIISINRMLKDLKNLQSQEKNSQQEGLFQYFNCILQLQTKKQETIFLADFLKQLFQFEDFDLNIFNELIIKSDFDIDMRLLEAFKDKIKDLNTIRLEFDQNLYVDETLGQFLPFESIKKFVLINDFKDMGDNQFQQLIDWQFLPQLPNLTQLVIRLKQSKNVKANDTLLTNITDTLKINEQTITHLELQMEFDTSKSKTQITIIKLIKEMFQQISKLHLKYLDLEFQKLLNDKQSPQLFINEMLNQEQLQKNLIYLGLYHSQPLTCEQFQEMNQKLTLFKDLTRIKLNLKFHEEFFNSQKQIQTLKLKLINSSKFLLQEDILIRGRNYELSEKDDNNKTVFKKKRQMLLFLQCKRFILSKLFKEKIKQNMISQDMIQFYQYF